MAMARLAAATAAAGLLAGCAAMSGDAGKAARAPEPARPIATASFYTGRWYEIGRTPMKLTDGCVAGTTDYMMRGDRLIDRDACHKGSPAGKEKSFAGPVTILNPGQNTKVRVDYKVFGLFTARKTYWMLDHGDDWFIASDPAFENINLFTRAPRPSADATAQLTARAKALGYDVTRLEFPAQFPPGQP